MYIFKNVMECDFNQEKYPMYQEGVALIARGATGRWCEVMHGGPAHKAYLVSRGIDILRPEQARAAIESNEGDWADF